MKKIAFFLLVFFLLTTGCNRQEQATDKPGKELLVYCGITMIKPMAEIGTMIEKQEGCKITITKGGSGNLLKAIRANMVGDLYLPGSDSYIETSKKEGLVTETVYVGQNKAVMMVRKNNPKGISPDLTNLLRKDLYVAVGNPNSGSIGRETKKVLERKNIFDGVIDNARILTTDSKNLINVLKDEKADLVINWYATATWPENQPYVDVLPIADKYATPKKLVIGLLKTSRYPEIARKFMALAASKKGQDIFQKYGLYNVP
ncbi:MAG: molybdate ABC transporter substrate-binding protein [Deltaproteobacteria bacterium]|nr:molybdate ABC transporter substrate-binding protein [Deltaproteobacteria bacterium]